MRLLVHVPPDTDGFGDCIALAPLTSGRFAWRHGSVSGCRLIAGQAVESKGFSKPSATGVAGSAAQGSGAIEGTSQMNPLSQKQLLLATSELNRKSLAEDVRGLRASTASMKQRAKTISLWLLVGSVVVIGVVVLSRKEAK